MVPLIAAHTITCHGVEMTLVLERGDITFFYRPAVQPVEGPVTPGVQSFFLVLGARGKHRRIRIGKKRMPAPSGERLWARVERVGSFQRVVGDQLESETYVTKTRGERFQPGARPIAQGCYAFVRHEEHTHLAYRIDQLLDPDAPEEVRPPDAASLIVLYERTPRTRATWTVTGHPELLDEEGEELVLVGVDDEPERELGIEVLPAFDSVLASRHDHDDGRTADDRSRRHRPGRAV